jgi:hypothetical protein
MYFLSDLSHNALFNRKLNLSHLPKTNTYYAQLKAGVKRGRDALDDLRRRGGRSFEGAYLVGNSGKVSKYTTDKIFDEVSPQKLTKTNPTTLLAVLHNHPRDSSLSYADISLTKPERTIDVKQKLQRPAWAKPAYKITKRPLPAEQIVNTTPGGSYFRSYFKKEIPRHKVKQNYEDVKKIVEQEMKSVKPGTWTDKDHTRRVLVSSHLANRSLANQGVIHYRAKLTPKDRRTLDFWLQRSPKLRALYDGK